MMEIYCFEFNANRILTWLSIYIVELSIYLIVLDLIGLFSKYLPAEAYYIYIHVFVMVFMKKKKSL